MTAATTTLPLFWRLSSANKGERLDASVKLVAALQQFQENHNLVVKNVESGSDEDKDEDEESEGDAEDEDDGFKTYSAKLDSENAPDVAYAIRRLIRGLASPRESSRLGFAVALTELLSRIGTVTCEQVLILLKNASQTSGSMSGQEERDMLFARLFGLQSIVQSGLLFNKKPLRSSSTSSSSFKGFESFLAELLDLGEKKSWLRESCWWTLLSAVDALSQSSVPWKERAYEILFKHVYVNDKSWSPEKVALTLGLQKARPDADWETFCSSYFKSPYVLSTTNLTLLGRLLKASISEGATEDDMPKQTVGPWKPQLHFVWDAILGTLLSSESSSASTGNFQDFYRAVVDETLFASSSSPQRKYWGFLAVQKALQRLPTAHLPMLFTKNFMRTWINQLSKNDRYLHKISRQVASDVQHVVEKDPEAGFTLVLQLIGTNGSFQFDRITKTKTIETILASTDSAGIKEYTSYLLNQVNEGEQGDSLASVDERRTWIIDQLANLIRQGSIPKTDENIQTILDWLATYAFFTVVKKSSKSSNLALHHVSSTPFSDELQITCRSKLLSCLADLTNLSTAVDKTEDSKSVKIPGVASDGSFWISKVLKTIVSLEKDSKHVKPLHQLDEDEKEARDNVFSVTEKIKARATNLEAARGAELLLSALTLKSLCDDNSEADWEDIRECTKQFVKLFALVEGEKKKQKEVKQADAERSPIDLIVDVIIGLLENSTSFTRIIADQSFSMLTSMVTNGTIELILTQLERRDPSDEAMDQDVESDDSADNSDQGGSEVNSNEDTEDESSSISSDEDEEDDNEEDTEALRQALQDAISTKTAGSGGEESSGEASMDDEQMMAIDEKLAAVFRTRAQERKRGKDAGAQREATYFKNRVLDLVEIYMKKQASNPLVLRFILPLVELIATASFDEKQLSDKAKGILRSRLSKTKDAAPVNDVPKAVELLESLHLRARKAHSQEMVSTISMCCLFVTKALIITDVQAVLRIYKESITDFFTRKASSLNPSFISDFIRRHPLSAWSIGTHVTEVLRDAVNGFRQSQAFGILQIILTSLPQPESKKVEIQTFIPDISRAFLDTFNKASTAEKPLMNVAHMKQSLKVAQSICRFTKRLAVDSLAFEKAWAPAEWDALTSALPSSENFKASTSVANACQQIAKLIKADNSKVDGTSGKSARKRKQEVEEEGAGQGESAGRKPKRKKVRKVLNTTSN